MPSIPTTMRAVVLDEYCGPAGVRVADRPVPRPGPGQVLVRMVASPINPSDLGFLEGLYGLRKQLPVVAGFEGSGVVVAGGQGLWPRALLGRRVACAAPNQGDGTWAEYMLADARSCVPLLPHISTVQGSMLLVNPLTAWALIDLALRNGQRAVVQTAAASALGRMMLRLGRRRGLSIIHVVRRPEQADLLRSIGAQHVLDSSASDFEERLSELSRALDARLALDAVGGELTGRVLRSMPAGSRALVYGGLAHAAVQLDPRGLIFHGHTVDGFWLAPWLARQSPLALLRAAVGVQRLLGSDLRSHVRAALPLDDARRALDLYAGAMTEGKLLLMPALRRG